MNKVLIGFIIFMFLPHQEIDFLDYHQKFIKIEDLIVNENFKEAETELEPLLKEYEPSFVKDYIILAQICLMNKDKSKSIIWLKKSMEYGAKLNCLKEIQFLNENITTDDWDKIKMESKDLKTIYYSKINISLGKSFNRNYQKEQDDKSEKSYRGVVNSNFNKIKSLTDKGTFPGEYLIGIDDADVAPKISECSFGNSKAIVTLLHYDYPIIELTENVLVTAIKKGQLHPRDFAAIFTFEKNRNSKLYYSSYKTKKNLPNYNFGFPFEERKDNAEKINADRKKFGICSLETDKKKEFIEEKYGMKLQFGYR